MGLTEGHLLNDECGAWEPIGGLTDKPSLSVHPQPVCCESLFPQFPKDGFKYPRKEYLALLDVMYQAIGDYKEAVEDLRKLDEGVLQRKIIVDHYRAVLSQIEGQINVVSWILAEISEVRDDDSE